MKKRILIVEDESIVALDIQNRLEQHGFEISAIVSTGSRALESAVSDVPDLVLMDINLKGSIDGIETASLIKRSIDCPIIFLTAFADEKTLKKARISDASGYILKPFREGELLITIDLAIKRADLKKKIQDNNNWLYGTLNNINDAVITVSNENRIIFLNMKAGELLENKLNPGDIFTSDSVISMEGERTYFHSGDRKIDIDYFQTEIPGEEGEILGYVHFIHDVSKQVAFEKGLENARVASEKSHRAKNDFLANVTHELRTPLNTIIGMNSIISEISEDDEISTMHELINSAAENLLEQLNDILELSEIDNGKIKVQSSRFSIDQIVGVVVDSFHSQIELKSLKIIVESGNNIPFMNGDKNKIREIIACLLSNAVKFTKKGNVTIKYAYFDNLLEISIEDTGIGLSETQKKSIFNLFTQVDSSHSRIYGGTGLGLTLVNELIALLNGTIKVDSKVSVGTKITVSIPVEISSDQKSSVKDIHHDSKSKIIENLHKSDKASSRLVTFLTEINELLEKDEHDIINKKIKEYSNKINIDEMNYETLILFRVSIAIKLKNKEKFEVILKEVLDQSINSAGGIYENSYS